MKTLSAHAEIGGDGMLRLEVPCDLPPGLVDVVLVVQPAEERPPLPARSGLFLGKVPVPVDVDAILEEVNRAWKTDFEP
jgi:hypothetical protein